MTRRVPIERRVAERLRVLREAQGLSQAALAERAGTSRSQVAAVERGDRAPTITTLDVFSRALRVKLTDLLDEAEPSIAQRNPPDAAEKIAATLRVRGPRYLSAFRRVFKIVDRLVQEERRRQRP